MSHPILTDTGYLTEIPEITGSLTETHKNPECPQEDTVKCSKCELDKNIKEFYKNRRECKSCYNSERLCKHDIQKTHCKKCGGSQICSHSKQRSTCRECPNGGSSFCEHLSNDGKRKQKGNCIICNKNNFCEHELQINNCRKCIGGSICEHKKGRHYCIICSPDSKYFCQECRVSRVDPNKNTVCKKCKK